MSKELYFSTLLDFYGAMLTPRQLKVMESYYNNDLSLSEIAINLGISKQGVRDIIKRSEISLKNLDEKLCFIEWMRNAEKAKVQALAILKEIKSKIENENSVIELLDRLQEIINNSSQNEI
ncbi:MAG: DNA-binding protein [Clostridia bacterium]|nr:DNA-binding protein [Clostridia bacterium]